MNRRNFWKHLIGVAPAVAVSQSREAAAPLEPVAPVMDGRVLSRERFEQLQQLVNELAARENAREHPR